jgi:hypothetical protein
MDRKACKLSIFGLLTIDGNRIDLTVKLRL